MTTTLSRRAFFGRATAPSEPAERSAAPMLAAIADTCLAENGAYCRTCGDACAQDAIRFRLMPRGRSRVDVDADRCTGCGDCLAPCPAGAISLAPAKETPHES
ncbi:4Fe-4S dicluster domain-containing protein [Niveispirillum sp. KHB5.9]|uniref:4Fe-4S dicluster domain-containing protein n=1 Tax=Niveispirillum sp. KHB5.9 TaxID=3400269 RepID=UPI003A8AD5CE